MVTVGVGVLPSFKEYSWQALLGVEVGFGGEFRSSLECPEFKKPNGPGSIGLFRFNELPN